MDIPEELQETFKPELKTPLPAPEEFTCKKGMPLLIYNLYNLDPSWKEGVQANRVLLLEPSIFSKYPVSGKTIEFILALAGNIPGIQVFTGEFEELIQQANSEKVFFREHPLNSHYSGIEEPRDWMFDVKGYYPSFFAFWKKCKKQIDLK
jgi:deoxyribodipyrimidine photo-lyase